MKMFEIYIDPAKFDKSREIKTKNGVAYLITGVLRDEKNEHGQDIALWLKQTDEERKEKVDKVYVGNGKVFWSDDSDENKKEEVSQEKNKPEDDSLPF